MLFKRTSQSLYRVSLERFVSRSHRVIGLVSVKMVQLLDDSLFSAKVTGSVETLVVDWWWISSCGDCTGGCFQVTCVAWRKLADQCRWHFQLQCFATFLGSVLHILCKKVTPFTCQIRQYATELREGLTRYLQEYLSTWPTRSSSKLVMKQDFLESSACETIVLLLNLSLKLVTTKEAIERQESRCDWRR